MTSRAVQRIAQLPSSLGVAARQAYLRARARGIAIRPLAERAHLTEDALADAQRRLPVRAQIEFLNQVAAALDDDALGVALAQEFEPRRSGLFYYVLASAESLRAVLERAARYTGIVNEGIAQDFVDGRRIGLVLRYRGVLRQIDRHQIEFWLVALVRMCRTFLGVRLSPVRVRVAHQPGRGRAKLSRFLGCEVEYGADIDEILFTREQGELRLRAADSYLHRLLVEVCEQALSRQRRVTESFAARVENAIAPRLPHGQARARLIAAEFGMSERTFARRLADEGTTFSRLVDRLRLGLARQYLQDERMPVSRVAWLLGYREVSAFTHAFRRWTGKSPSEARRRRA